LIKLLLSGCCRYGFLYSPFLCSRSDPSCKMGYRLELSLVLGFLAIQAWSVPVKRAPYKYIQPLANGDAVFELGNKTFLANVVNPKTVASVKVSSNGGSVPLTVINTDTSVITQAILQTAVASYLAGDDVFSEDFLATVLISSSVPDATLDASALTYLSSYDIGQIYVSGMTPLNTTSGQVAAATFASSPPPPGPYLATVVNGQLELATILLLYRDSYRDFLYGTYDANDGQNTHNSVEAFSTRFWDPMIPVPSRIYSWGDDRPLAGERVAVKDLYDVKGLVTSGGSQAWAYITPPANVTAPSVQKLIDLGAVIVGKYKLAQFASGADPWQWQDEHYPFNPRGDGWLTCSASSSGGGCSIAAYDWLDYAIGSDTGSSMRRPAAVSGVYG
jgi:hypothetical protein